MLGLTDAVVVAVITAITSIGVAALGFAGVLATVRRQKQPTAVELTPDEIRVEYTILQHKYAQLERERDVWKGMALSESGDRRRNDD